MTSPVVIEGEIHFRRKRKGSRKLVTGGKPALSEPPGRVPRVSRLMALAIRFDQLIAEEKAVDYAQLARLGHVSRARMTQIMNLRVLAPDIQEDLLFLPRVERGHDPIHMRQLQSISLVPLWDRQRRMWRRLLDSAGVEIDAVAALDDES